MGRRIKGLLALLLVLFVIGKVFGIPAYRDHISCDYKPGPYRICSHVYWCTYTTMFGQQNRFEIPEDPALETFIEPDKECSNLLRFFPWSTPARKPWQTL